MGLAAAGAAALAVLAACERKPAAPPPGAGAAPETVAEVAAADSYGAAGEAVTGLAFWSHPTVAFESLLLAAGPDGVTAYRIETGEAVFKIPGGAGAAEVFYAGEGAGAQGYLLAADAGAYRLHAISQNGEGATPVPLEAAGSPAPVYCAGGGPAPVVYEAAPGGLVARTLVIGPAGAALQAARRLADIKDAIGCDVDPLTDEVVTVSGDGAVRRIDPKSGAVFGVALPSSAGPASAALAAGRGENGEPQGQAALLEQGTGVIRLFDAKDGRALGAVRVKATFDLDAVASAGLIAVGSANYGGVYRDGALAVVTSGDGAPVRLVPWNGVMGALSLPIAAAIDPRATRVPAAEEDVISIDVIEP